MVARSIWDHPAFRPSAFSEREAFLWLVSEAAWKPRTVRSASGPVDLERGQLCASARFMAQAWGWSKSRVARYLDRLEKRDMVDTQTGTGQLLITVCNYDKFQAQRDTSGTRAGQHPGHERDSSGTNEKKGKKGKKEEEGKGAAPIHAPLLDFVSEEQARAWMEHRKALRKPMTARGVTMLRNGLAEIEAQGMDPAEALDTAIERGWMTVKAEWVRNAKEGRDGKPRRSRISANGDFWGAYEEKTGWHDGRRAYGGHDGGPEDGSEGAGGGSGGPVVSLLRSQRR
jgi:hypothetical protein